MERTRRRYAKEARGAALARRAQRRPSKRPKLDGEKEAHLVALTGSEPPPGLSQWSLRRRLASQEVLAREMVAWQAERNTAAAKVDWRFTTGDACIKLARLYPVTQL